MLLQSSSPNLLPHSQPFQDIINQQIQNIYEDIQRSQVTKSEIHLHTTDSSKENNLESEEVLLHDKTIKK